MTGTASMIYLIDDDASFLKATARFLRSSGFTVQTFSSAQIFLLEIPRGIQGCVIVDLHMPGMSGLDLQEALARANRIMPMIFLTGQGDIATTVQAMRGGAEDFLEKTTTSEKLLAAVNRSHLRAAAMKETSERARQMRSLIETLSIRERQVLRHLVQGKLNKQIAADLDITERTVKAHRTAIRMKLKVPSVAELTRLAHEAGELDAVAADCTKGQ